MPLRLNLPILALVLFFSLPAMASDFTGMLAIMSAYIAIPILSVCNGLALWLRRQRIYRGFIYPLSLIWFLAVYVGVIDAHWYRLSSELWFNLFDITVGLFFLFFNFKAHRRYKGTDEIFENEKPETCTIYVALKNSENSWIPVTANKVVGNIYGFYDLVNLKTGERMENLEFKPGERVKAKLYNFEGEKRLMAISKAEIQKR